MADLVIRGARVPDWCSTDRDSDARVVPGSRVDIRVNGTLITAVEPDIPHQPNDEVLDVFGGVVLPGLHDHHLHLRSVLAAMVSINASPEHVNGWQQFAELLRGSSPDSDGWRRVVGYHESVAGDLDRSSLDAIVSSDPVRVQHRSGAMWTLNTKAIEILALDRLDVEGIERDESGRPTGRLFRMDDWLSEVLVQDDPMLQVGKMSKHLASLGVTGLTEATPGATAQSVQAFVKAAQAGELAQRLHVMCPAELAVTGSPLVTHGPYKILLDDDTLPALIDLAGDVVRAHAAGVPVAVHCVTQAQIVLTISALQIAGVISGDRIEHGSVIPSELIDSLAVMGVTVVTNPGLPYVRGDNYVVEVEERDLPNLYRLASLLNGGVAVAAGTDAPFGPLNPWTSVSFALSRRTAGGTPLGPGESVALGIGIGLFAGRMEDPASPRRVAAGEPADLCFLADGFLPSSDDSEGVLATLIGGRVAHSAL